MKAFDSIQERATGWAHFIMYSEVEPAGGPKERERESTKVTKGKRGT